MGAQTSKSRFPSYTECDYLSYAERPPCPLYRLSAPTTHEEQVFTSGSSTCHLAPWQLGVPSPLGVHMLPRLPASTCLCLHPSASFCISLCPLHIWVARVRCWASEQPPAPLLHTAGTNQIWWSKACWALCLLCSETSSSVCPIYLIILLLSQVPFTWNRQVFLWCSSVSWQRGCASEGHAQVLRQTKKHAVLFIL